MLIAYLVATVLVGAATFYYSGWPGARLWWRIPLAIVSGLLWPATAVYVLVAMVAGYFSSID